MAFSRTDQLEREFEAAKQYITKGLEPNQFGGLVAAQAATSTKEGEITQRLAQLEMKVNLLHSSVCKVKDILEPILFDGPARLKNNIGEACMPDRTKVGGRINDISCCIEETKAIVDSILEGIEL